MTQDMANLIASMGLITGIITLVVAVLTVVIFWKIFSKAGYSGALSLLLLVPIANLVVLCILGFGEWPIIKELKHYRGQRG